MIQEGQIVLFRFPQTDLKRGKLRPALLLRKVPGSYDDWLICMISTNLSQKLDEFDELITSNDLDFKNSGLKETSLFRILRLAVVVRSTFIGVIGNISHERLSRIKTSISNWVKA